MRKLTSILSSGEGITLAVKTVGSEQTIQILTRDALIELSNVDGAALIAASSQKRSRQKEELEADAFLVFLRFAKRHGHPIGWDRWTVPEL